MTVRTVVMVRPLTMVIPQFIMGETYSMFVRRASVNHLHLGALIEMIFV
jgi:hypothetical protein